MGKRLQKAARGRITLQDVAARAGCSTATVSRTLNGASAVKPAVRNRVLAAMTELGYAPNHAARALRSRRSRMVGAVIPTLKHAIYASLVEALQQELGGGGYSLLLATSEYDLEQELIQAQLLLERGAEGIVLVGGSHDPRLHPLLHSYGTVYTHTYVYQDDRPHPCVGFNNRAAGARIAEFLISLGHRRIAMIAGLTAGNDRAGERVEGLRAGIEARGLALPAGRVLERPYGIENGREALRTLHRREPAVTAVVCGNDILALGAHIEAAALGLLVPQDLSIVGIDDLEFAAHLSPPLTTLAVPARDMGRLTAQQIMHRLRGQPAAEHIMLEAKLIVRGTTDRCPDSGPSR